MKIAVFHNFLDNIGGAEMVDLLLARWFEADIYTTNIDAEKIKKMGFADVLPRIYSIGKVPTNAPWKQELSYWQFRFLNVEKRFKRHYDFYIIAGDWAMAGALHNQPNFWYVYSPTREIWDLYEYTRSHGVPKHLRWFFDLWVLLRRVINKHDAAKIKKIVAISKNTSQRVKKCLGRAAGVIYPPVDTAAFQYKQNGDFLLSVNRLITHKRVDLQIEAFRKMPQEKLVIIGSYEQSQHFRRYADYIQSIKPNNVEIRHWVSTDALKDLYANCRGFITTAKDEDFGITPIEAMAAGKPVIAPNEGGYQETVVSGQHGILIDDINIDKIITAVKKISQNPKQYQEACFEQAKKFTTDVFIKKISNLITATVNERHS